MRPASRCRTSNPECRQDLLVRTPLRDALLANRLATRQRWEEDRSQKGFYALSGTSEYETPKALSHFHRRAGAVVVGR